MLCENKCEKNKTSHREEILAKYNKRLLKYKKNSWNLTTTHKKTTQRMGQIPEQTLHPRIYAEDKEVHEDMPHIVCHKGNAS